MTAPRPDRLRIALTIIACHGVLMGMLVLLLMTDALLPEEFTPLLTLLAPVTAIYAGSVFRYLTAGIRAAPDAPPEPPLPHADLVRGLVLGHFALMLFLLLAKAVFNWIEFSTMVVLMSLLETSFGGYMGAVLGAVFGDK